MANFKGANLRYDNSDEQGRVYNISAEAVLNNGKVEAVQSINLYRIDGGGDGNGSIGGFGDNTSITSTSINFNGIPFTEQKQAMAAMFDFAASIAAQAESQDNE